jgi:DNA-directed RNA polymerase
MLCEQFISRKPVNLCELVLPCGHIEVNTSSSSEEQPAFFHSYEYLRGHKLGVIRLNPEVAERMSRDGLRETLHPRHLPMLVKPKPWLSYDQGGYLYSQSTSASYCPLTK